MATRDEAYLRVWRQISANSANARKGTSKKIENGEVGHRGSIPSCDVSSGGNIPLYSAHGCLDRAIDCFLCCRLSKAVRQSWSLVLGSTNVCTNLLSDTTGAETIYTIRPLFSNPPCFRQNQTGTCTDLIARLHTRSAETNAVMWHSAQSIQKTIADMPMCPVPGTSCRWLGHEQTCGLKESPHPRRKIELHCNGLFMSC